MPSYGNPIDNLWRLREILSVLIKYGLIDFLNKPLLSQYFGYAERITFFRQKQDETILQKSLPERMRLAVEELGPTFIKFGQIMSTRVDLIPADYIHELTKLQNQVKPFAFDEVKKIIEQELGLPIEQAFNSIEQKPLAAASLGQVHRAETKTGDQVVIKVQRPNIQETIDTDIQILYMLAQLVERGYAEAYLYQPVEIVRQFDRSIHQELNFVREGYNLETFNRNFASNAQVECPKVHWKFVTEKVLTMNFVKGRSIKYVNDLTTNKRKALASICAKAIYQQIFKDGFFHADPHPGNLLINESSVTFLDLGMIGRIDEKDMLILQSFMQAIASRRVSQIIDSLETMEVLHKSVDKRQLSLDLRELIDSYYYLPLSQIKLDEILPRFILLMQEHRIKLPSNYALLLKSLITIEGVIRSINPQINLISEIKPLLQQDFLRRFSPNKVAEEIGETGLALWKSIGYFPEIINEIVKNLRNGGSLNLNIKHQGLNRLIEQIDRTGDQLTIALVLAAIILGSSIVLLLNLPPYLFGYSVVGLFGYVLSVLLGFGLVLSVLLVGRKQK